jgi:hypothetical protein
MAIAVGLRRWTRNRSVPRQRKKFLREDFRIRVAGRRILRQAARHYVIESSGQRTIRV